MSITYVNDNTVVLTLVLLVSGELKPVSIVYYLN